jgi:hypothetical protein
MMFCTECGAADQNPNAYCKRCGEWLSGRKSTKGQSANPADRMNAMTVFNACSAVMGLAAAIALFATYAGRPEAKWSVYAAGSWCLVISIHQTISFFYALELRRRFKKGRQEPRQLDASDVGRNAASLGSGEKTEFVGARTVTENTTELLEPVPRVSGRSRRQ